MLRAERFRPSLAQALRAAPHNKRRFAIVHPRLPPAAQHQAAGQGKAQVEIKDAVRCHPSLRKVREVVAVALKRHAILRIELAVSVETTEEFLLCVHAEDRPAVRSIVSTEFLNVLELCMAQVRVNLAGDYRSAGLAFTNVVFFSSARTVVSEMEKPCFSSAETIPEGCRSVHTTSGFMGSPASRDLTIPSNAASSPSCSKQIPLHPPPEWRWYPGGGSRRGVLRGCAKAYTYTENRPCSHAETAALTDHHH